MHASPLTFWKCLVWILIIAASLCDGDHCAHTFDTSAHGSALHFMVTKLQECSHTCVEALIERKRFWEFGLCQVVST